MVTYCTSKKVRNETDMRENAAEVQSRLEGFLLNLCVWLYCRFIFMPISKSCVR